MILSKAATGASPVCWANAEAAIATGRLAWIHPLWAAIVNGDALGISLTATGDERDGHYSLWAMRELTICAQAKNRNARILTAWEEFDSGCVRLRYTFDHPQRKNVIYVEHGRVLEQPRSVMYL